MFTSDFFEQSIEIILIILFIPVITLNIVCLAYVIYSKYLNLAKVVVNVVISLILGMLCIPVITLTLLYIGFIIYEKVLLPNLCPYPCDNVPFGFVMLFFVFPVAILFSLCVSLGGGALVSMISGFVLHKFFR
jgi:hypothetical protein